jgi:hypothetical protein
MSVVVRGYADDSKPVIAWDNPLKGSTITSGDSFSPGFAASAITTYPTWEGARPVDPFIAWSVTFDMGSEYDIDYVAVSAMEQTAAGTMTLQSSSDGTNYTTVEAAIPLSQPTLVLFDEITTRYLRILFAQEITYIGNVMAGLATRLERPIYVGHAPATLNRQTEITGTSSENGQYLGRVIRSQLVRTTVDLQNIDPEFLRDELDPFFAAAREQPFYWAWRPADYDEVIYAWMDGDPQVTNQRANGMMQASFSVRGRQK